MHVLFAHSNFPAQFGPLAARLVEAHGYLCTFVSEAEPGEAAGIRKVRYHPAGRTSSSTHPCARAFDGDMRHAAGIYEAVNGLARSLRPDVVVGHASLGPTLFLREVYPDVPIVSYFEDYSPPERCTTEFRPEWPRSPEDVLRTRPQNATTLLHLEDCDAGYSPTHFQRGLLPTVYQPKVSVIHDGIDTRFWRRQRPAVHGTPRVVTYVSRALDPLRGFDIFMRMAKRICEEYRDVIFLVVGSDVEGYGDEHKQFPEKSFKEHVLRRDDYDLEQIRFLGWVPPESLVQILGMSDLHVYLTVPIALSWSMLNAMACGCVVLGSDTGPVREVITDGENGLLRAFSDVDALARAALEVLERPEEFGELGRAAERTVVERYSLDVTVPRMIELYKGVVG